MILLVGRDEPRSGSPLRSRAVVWLFRASALTHIWELLAFSDGKPIQLVAGNSGTLLAHPVDGSSQHGMLKTAAANSFQVKSVFGYTLLEPNGGGWRVRLYAIDDNALIQCATKPRGKVACE
jgi:hypothetical protein